MRRALLLCLPLLLALAPRPGAAGGALFFNPSSHFKKPFCGPTKPLPDCRPPKPGTVPRRCAVARCAKISRVLFIAHA